MHVDLECHYYRGETHPFSVKLLDHALDFLIEDARNAYRVYELFAIRRPGNIWKHLWVQLIDVPERVWARYRQARSAVQRCQSQAWSENALPLLSFDPFFSWRWDDTDPEDECWLRARQGTAFKA